MAEDERRSSQPQVSSLKWESFAQVNNPTFRKPGLPVPWGVLQQLLYFTGENVQQVGSAGSGVVSGLQTPRGL